MDVRALALGPEDRNQLDGCVDRAEPVRNHVAELHCFAWLYHKILFTQQNAHTADDHIHPVVAIVHVQRVRWLTAPGADANLERMRAAGRTTIRERPHRETIAFHRDAPHARIGRRRAIEQVILAHAQRRREAGDEKRCQTEQVPSSSFCETSPSLPPRTTGRPQ